MNSHHRLDSSHFGCKIAAHSQEVLAVIGDHFEMEVFVELEVSEDCLASKQGAELGWVDVVKVVRSVVDTSGCFFEALVDEPGDATNLSGTLVCECEEG